MASKLQKSSFGRELHTKRIYAIAALVSFIFLVFGIAFIVYLSYLSNLNTTNSIQNATHAIKLEIDDYIAEDFDDLASAAIMPSDREMTADDAPFERVVRRLSDYNSFVQVGIADPEGHAIWTDKGGTENGDVSKEPFFQEALAGNQAMSYTYHDIAGEPSVNYYAVPIANEATGEIAGVLFAADPTDQLRTITSRLRYDGQGLVAIIDRRGAIIVRPESDLLVSKGESLFDPPTEVPEVEVERLRSNLLDGVGGNAALDVSGSFRRISYEPLDYNDWYIFYSVPNDLVNTEYHTLTIAAILLILSAFLIFLLFVLLIRHINRKNLAKLEQIAFIDPITGKKSLQKFGIDSEAKRADPAAEQYGICWLDIEGFKYINDLFGREVGDEFIRYFSKSIEETLQEGEDFARVMADIFIILLKPAKINVLRARFASLSRRIAVFPPALSNGYSIKLYVGIFMPNGVPGDISLMDMADRALVAHKAVKENPGSDLFGFYTSEMHEQKEWEATIASKMEHALEEDEFTFYLQPKIGLAQRVGPDCHSTGADTAADDSGRTCSTENRIADPVPLSAKDSFYGAEVLVRWNSPEYGMLAPGRFVDLFERNGFVVKMDQYIFEEACRFYREEILDKQIPPFPLSANVSRRALEQPGFVSSYAAIKSKYRIPDGCIELEFTESLASENLEQFKNTIAMLKGVGFKISLDDFGAAYSSLNVLKSIPADVLKLDRLFFLYGDDAERGRVLVRDIIAMAKDLGMKTVAEGIDEAWQVEDLREWGCDVVQGYIFSKPLPPTEFLTFRNAWSSCESKPPM